MAALKLSTGIEMQSDQKRRIYGSCWPTFLYIEHQLEQYEQWAVVLPKMRTQ
jgi:hypothetical protein